MDFLEESVALLSENGTMILRCSLWPFFWDWDRCTLHASDFLLDGWLILPRLLLVR